MSRSPVSSSVTPGGIPRQRVRPVQERSRRKIDSILDATAGLLARGGVEAVSTLAIAEAAGIPPATVYHYFENRLAVFAALAERAMAAVDADLMQRLAVADVGAGFSARDLLLGLFEAYRETPGYVQILRALRAEPLFAELVRESNRRGAELVQGVLGAHTRLSEERARRVSWILSEFCEQILESALVADPVEAQALLDELVEMVDALFRHYRDLP